MWVYKLLGGRLPNDLNREAKNFNLKKMEKKKLKKLELTKKTIIKLDKEDVRELKGGNQASTHAHDTHVNTCFTYNCC